MIGYDKIKNLRIILLKKNLPMISTPCSTGGSQTRRRALQVEAAMDRLLGGSGGRAVLRVRVSDWAVNMNLFVVSFSSPETDVDFFVS